MQNSVILLSKLYWLVLIACFNLMPYVCKANGTNQCTSVEEVVQILEDTSWIPAKVQFVVTVKGTAFDGVFRKTHKIDRLSTVTSFNDITYWNTSDFKEATERKECFVLTPEVAYWIKPDNSYTTSPMTDLVRGMHLNPLLYSNRMIDNMSNWKQDRVPLSDFIKSEAQITQVGTTCPEARKTRISANYDVTSATLEGDPVIVHHEWVADVDQNVAGHVWKFLRRYRSPTTERIFEHEVAEEGHYNGFKYPAIMVMRDREFHLERKSPSEIKATVTIQVLGYGDELAPIDVAAILSGLQ